jgi:hypothetical protein
MPTFDDVFSAPVIDWDPFDAEVDALVLSVYGATIEGIGRLHKRGCPRGNLTANPELQVEIDVWEEQISAMKRHAGNMGLVSLVTLLHDWIGRKSERPDWKSQFQQLEGDLGAGPVSLSALEELMDARNSIVHHRGKSTFQWSNKDRTVSERFLDFDETSNEERVAVSKSILEEEADRMKQQVKQWIDAKRKRAEASSGG